MESKYTLFTIVSILFWTISANAQTASRLIAQTVCSYDGTTYSPVDSGTYTYSMGRGLSPYGFGWLFDLNPVYAYNSTTSKYSNSSLTTQTFDARNNPIIVLTQSWDTSGSSWANLENDLYGYDANNNDTSYIDQLWDPSTKSWQNGNKQVNTFDSKNNFITRTIESWDIPSNSWVGFLNLIYTYNSSNKLKTYTVQEWQTVSKRWVTVSMDYYRYDAKNNFVADSAINRDTVTGVWTNYSLELLTYNSANKVLTQTNQQWYSGAWLNYDNYLFTYDTSGIQVGQTWQKWDKSAWLNFSNFIYSYDGSNTETTDQVWDTISHSWLNTFKRTSILNTYDQPLVAFQYEWDAGSNRWASYIGDPGTRFYYETYTTSANELSANNSIKIYPSPANTLLNIDVKWNEAQTAIVAIYDMQGRLWEQWQTTNGVTYHSNISIARLPAGNYILKIRGENGQLTERFSVVH